VYISHSLFAGRFAGKNSMTEQRSMLIDVKTGEKRPAIPGTPTLSSAGAPWRGIFLEQHGGMAAEFHDMAAAEHIVVTQIGRPVEVEWKEQGHYHTLRVLPGESAILPAGVVFTNRTNDVGEFISITLDQKFVHCVVHEALEHGLELKLTRVVNDPLLNAIALAFRREVQTNYAGGAAYGDSLGSTLVMHLVRHHATKRLPIAVDRGGLGKRQLRQAIEYIHDHLGENLSLAAVAAQSGLSLFHFARMFKQATGLTPHQYILRARLKHARQLLITTQEPVADVACRVGFYDQSHFTAHFKRAYGLTPRTFRSQTITTR